jgi:hypothetical protein
MAQEGTRCELLVSSLNRAELPPFVHWTLCWATAFALLKLESTSPACSVRGENE